MDSTEALVTVSIVNYNNRKTIFESIESVIKQRYRNVELYIVDNNSTDGSREEIEEQIDKWNLLRNASLKNEQKMDFVKYFKNETNLGFGTSHNQVIRSSKGEYILLLNSDAILIEDFIENALRCFSAKDVGVVQGKVFRYDFEKHLKLNIIDTVGINMLKSRRTICRGQGQLDEGQFDKAEEIFGADGAVMFFKRESMDSVKVGIIKDIHKSKTYDYEYFDEDFFLYKEDIDLDWRLRLAGWKTMYCPVAVAYHGRGSGESSKTNYLDILKERKNISLFSKKLSFKHQRFMQLKNDSLYLLIRNLPAFVIKEVGTWIYVIFIEHFGFSHFVEMFKSIPLFLEKRKLVMDTKKVSDKDMLKWFC